MSTAALRSRISAFALVAVVGCTPAADPSTSPPPVGPPALADVLTYKGGNARTGAMPGPGPTGAPNVLWEHPLGGGTLAGPLVHDGRVIVAGGDGTVAAFDGETGRVEWEVGLPAAISATPTIAGDTLFVITVDGMLHTISLTDRSTGWSFPGLLPESIVSVAGDEVLVGAPGAIVALDRVTGRELWRVAAPGTDRSTVEGGIAYVGGDGSGTIVAVSLAERAATWRVETGGARVLTPAIAGGSIYGAARDVPGHGNVVLRLGRDGAEQWQVEPPGRERIAAHAVAGDRVYVTVTEPAAAVYALDAATGLLVWHSAIAGAIAGIPASDGRAIYVPGSETGLIALDPAHGTLLWSIDVGAIVDAELAVTGGLVFMTTVDALGGGRVLALADPDDPRIGARPSQAAPTQPAASIAGLPAPTIVSDTPVNAPVLLLSITAAPDGTIYAADLVNSRIVVRLPDGSVELWGEPGSANGQFDFTPPTTNDAGGGVAVSPDGELIAVGDGGNHRVQLFDRERRFLRPIGRLGRENGQFVNPCCVTVDADHNVWVVDVARADVQVFDETGRHLRTFAEPGYANGQLSRPGSAAVPGTGEVFIPDFGNRRVAVFSEDGTWRRNHGSRPGDGFILDEVSVVAVDALGRMYVLDTTQRIFVLDPTGAPLFTIPDADPTTLLELVSFTLDSQGMLYLSYGQGQAGRLLVVQLEPPIWPE